MRGHVEKHGENHYRILIDIGRDARGKRKRLSYTVRGTRKQAEVKLAELLSEVNAATYSKPSELTLGEYLDQYLDHAKTSVAPQTYRRYEQIVRRDLVPALGHVKLAALTPVQIQSFLAKSLGRKCKTRDATLSSQTVRHYYRVLNRALNLAVRWQLIPRNPCDLVDPPRVDEKEMIALDEVQVGEVLSTIAGSRLHIPVLLALTTGMRRGELLALRWGDVNLDTGECQVMRSLQETAEGLSYKTPKTRKGRRVVLLPQLALSALKAHRAKQNQEKLLLGPGYQDEDLIICRADGTPWPPSDFSSAYRRFMHRRGLSARFHDLRHTHATHLLKESVPVHVVSERLGHANSSITLNVYAHVLPTQQQEAVAKIDAAWGKTVEGG